MQEPKNLFISGAGAKTWKYYQKFGSPTTWRNSAASKHCQASQRRNSGLFQIICCTFLFELTHWQAKNTKTEALSSKVDHLSKLLEEKNQENKGLIKEKVFVSQLQDQHSIELAKLKTKLEDAHRQYQNTLKEEQSKQFLIRTRQKRIELLHL